MDDETYFWVFCGSECDAQFIGPHLCTESAQADIDASECDNDHGIIPMSLTEFARKMPLGAAFFEAGTIFDPRLGYSIVRRPFYPRASSDLSLALLRRLGELIPQQARSTA